MFPVAAASACISVFALVRGFAGSTLVIRLPVREGGWRECGFCINRKNHVDDEPPLQLSERARLRELEREVRELRMKADFLSKAAAYFAAEHR